MPRGNISINSVGYVIESFEVRGIERLVHRDTPQEFAEVFNTTGQKSQASITPYASRVFHAPTHGLGRNRIPADQDGDPDSFRRMWDSTCDTRWEAAVYRGIEESDSTETGLELIRASAAYKGKLLGLWTDDTGTDILLRSYNGSTTTWDAEATVAQPAANVTALDIISHKGSAIILHAGNNDHLVSLWDGSSITVPTTQVTANLLSDNVSPNEDIDAGLLAQAGAEVIAVLWHEANGTITFFSSTDAGDNWTDEAVDIASGNGPQGVVTVKGTDNEDKLILATREGLYEIDTAPATWTFRLIHPMPPHTDNGRRMTVHNGEVWFAQGVDDSDSAPCMRLFVSNGQWHVEAIPNCLHLHDGVPSDMLGPIRWMKSAVGFLYASIGGGAASRNARVICHNGFGWHSMRKHGTANQKIEWIDVSGDDDGNERLHYAVRTAATTHDTKFLLNPSTNPSSGVSIERIDTAYLDLPRINAGMPRINKAWLVASVDADNLSATTSGEYINLDYGNDGEARTANDLGDILSGTKSLAWASGAGVSNVGMAIRVNMLKTDMAADAGNPQLHSLELDFDPKLPTIERYTVRVDIPATADATGLPVETVISNLETARDSVVLVPMTYGNIGTKYVRVRLDFGESFFADAAADALASRTGTVDVVMTEVSNL